MQLVKIQTSVPENIEGLKYFTFSQNNSGGRFHYNESVCEYVIIQARSAQEANEIAESVGIYFNGCSDGRDCGCCGDRWSEAWRDDLGTEVPMIFEKVLGESPVDYTWANPGDPYAHVYHYDGTKTSYYIPDTKRLR